MPGIQGRSRRISIFILIAMYFISIDTRATQTRGNRSRFENRVRWLRAAGMPRISIELMPMAEPAKIGLSRKPKCGCTAPAATGMPRARERRSPDIGHLPRWFEARLQAIQAKFFFHHSRVPVRGSRWCKETSGMRWLPHVERINLRVERRQSQTVIPGIAHPDHLHVFPGIIKLTDSKGRS